MNYYMWLMVIINILTKVSNIIFINIIFKKRKWKKFEEIHAKNKCCFLQQKTHKSHIDNKNELNILLLLFNIKNILINCQQIR
jgi:hypothetical protein